MKFLIVIEQTKTGYSAYSPDLPGCIATGSTRAEIEQSMREAIEFHLEGLRAEHLEVPEPRSSSTYVEVPA
jgi:predicted RNase H-like HicB family nuclease